MKKLDFIIIGAQKSATTSLYKYLMPHPKIFMSSSKEAPFFSKDELYQAGWESFVAEYFEGAKQEQFWGTASPQYMGNPETPERIHSFMPDAKLIAVLRNPTDRAYSHYTMSVRRGNEERSFDEAIDELLKPDALQKARTVMPVVEADNAEEDESGHYLVWSEYGRILEDFLKHFPKEQLLVLYMDDIIEKPAEIYREVIDFIGVVDDGFVPANVGKVYHKGGTQRIIPESWREAVKSNAVFRLFWDRVPDTLRTRIRYVYDQKNLKKGSGQEGPSEYARTALNQHFADDVKKLELITGKQVPWKEFDSSKSTETMNDKPIAEDKLKELRV